MTNIKMFEISNFDGYGKVVCKGIFPAQSEASAKQLYCLNPHRCEITKKFGWCNIEVNDVGQSYHVYLNDYEYEIFSLDRARDSFSELITYDTDGNDIRPSNEITQWFCGCIQQSINELNRQCARSYKTQF